jgi:hypothetical protein
MKNNQGFDESNYHNFESKDLIAQVKSRHNLSVDESPDVMKNYMHKRLVLQATRSLNKTSVG